MLLIKIVLCSKFSRTEFINYKSFDMKSRTSFRPKGSCIKHWFQDVRDTSNLSFEISRKLKKDERLASRPENQLVRTFGGMHKVAAAYLSHRMYLSISFRNSTAPQNSQLNI